MNEKGFGIKEFVIIIAVIFICMIIIVSLYQSIFKKENVELETPVKQEQTEKLTYKELENKLELAAERYQNDNYSGSIENPEVWTLSYSMLKEEKYIDNLTDPKDGEECRGYVEFIQDGGRISYTPFLKCGKNYQTKGYDENNLD